MLPFLHSLGQGGNHATTPPGNTDSTAAYHYKVPSGLSRWKSSLGMTAAGQGGIDVLCWGDSIMESFFMPGIDSFNSTVHRLKVKLQDYYNPAGVQGGYGYIPMTRGYGTNSLITRFGTVSGPWAPTQSVKRMSLKADAGANGCYVSLKASDPVFNRTATDAVQFLAIKGSNYGTARWDVSEGTPLGAAGIGTGLQTGTHALAAASIKGGVRFGASEGHTSKLTLDPTKDNYIQWAGAASGGVVAYDGFIAYNGDFQAGVRVHDLAFYGHLVTTMYDNMIDLNHGSSRWGIGSTTGGASNAKLVIMDWITNDCGRNVAPQTTVATFKQKYSEVIDYHLNLPSQPAVLLYIPPQGDNANLAARPVGERYVDFVNAIYEIAEAREHVAILDLFKYFNETPQDNVAGNPVYDAGWYSDGIHYTLKGYSDVADLLFDVITWGAPPIASSYTAPDPNTLSWSSAYTPQASEVVNGTLEITGQKFRSLDGAPVVDLRQIPDDTLILAHGNHLWGGGVLFFSQYKRHRFKAWGNIAYNMPYQDTTNWGNWFWCGANAKEVVIENNYIEGRGVQLELTDQAAADALKGFTYRKNIFKSIHGEINTFLSSRCSVVNIQGNDTQLGGVLVEWNQVINEENKSHTEDLMNFYRVKSKVASPITVRHNYLCGAFYNDVNRVNGDGIFSGGGIIFEMSQGAKVYGNFLSNLKNYCIGLAATNDMEVYENKAIVASIHSDGNYFNTGSSGLWSSKYYEGNWGVNNVFHDNEVGVRNTYGSTNPADHAHQEIGVTDGSATSVNNTTWESLGKFPTKADEEALFAEWQLKVKENNITLGPATT